MVPLGIDKEKLNIQLSRLEEHLIELQGLKDKLASAKDELLFSALERILHLTVEDCLNIGNHIISGMGFRRPDIYKEVFIILKENKIISDELCKKAVILVSLRNRLVHLYWKITNEEVIAVLDDLDVFRKYVEEISSALKIINQRYP